MNSIGGENGGGIKTSMQNFVEIIHLDEARCIQYNTLTKDQIPTCYTPITIEDTWCGRHSEYILKAIEGALKPNS